MNREQPRNNNQPPRMGGGRGPRGLMMLEKPKNGRKTLWRLLKYIGVGKYLFISFIWVSNGLVKFSFRFLFL